MIAFKNFMRTTFSLVLFLFSQCVTDRDLILRSNFSTLNTPYYRGKNKESNKKAPYNFGILFKKDAFFVYYSKSGKTVIN